MKTPHNSTTSKSAYLIKDVRRNTKRIFSSEQKILIIMEGIRGESSVAELCREHSISTVSKDFDPSGSIIDY